MKKKTLAITIVIGGATGFMAACWLHPAPNPTPPPNPRAETAQPDLNPGTRLAPGSPFAWSQIESEDLAILRQHLVAIGCPAATIKDILRARVMAAYEARIARKFNPLARFWGAGAQCESEVKMLGQERDALLAGLGLEPPSNDLGIPAEKLTYVAEALRRFPCAYPPPGSAIPAWTEALKARQARIAYLAPFLTPDELLNYRITQDGMAATVNHTLQGLNLTDEQFKQAFLVLDGEDVSKTNGKLRPDLEAKLEAALGPESYAAYSNQNSPENMVFNDFARVQGLSPEQLQKLQQLRADAQMDGAAYRQAVAEVLQKPMLINKFFNSPFLSRRLMALK